MFEDCGFDIVSINETGGHQIYTNDGNAQFLLHPEQFASPGALAVAAGMFNIDDRSDVAVTGTTGSDIFFNDGRGNFGPGDTGIPVLTLLGAADIDLIVESAYTDAGATAMDDVDGDITADIVVDNPVDTNVIGVYLITYSVLDRSGNAATPITRTVTVDVRQGTGGGGGGAAGVGMLLSLLVVALRMRSLRLRRASRREI